jgi:hypothetical protein
VGEAFLFFRRAFSCQTIFGPGLAASAAVADAGTLYTRVDHFMDSILLGTIAGYEG